jgi:hypothetical protein
MSKLAGLILCAIGLTAACAAPVAPTETPARSQPAATATASVTSSALPAETVTGVAGTFVTGTIIFVGDTISPIAFDGVNCVGVGRYAGIHKGAHLAFIDADTASAETAAGDATLDPGTPAGEDCKFTWSGYLLPAQHYVARLGQIHEWQLTTPVQSPLFLTFKASEVQASASP